MASKTTNALKQLVNRIVDDRSPSQIVSGVVVEGGHNPKIGYDEAHAIPQSLITIPQHLSEYEMEVTYTCPVTGEEVNVTMTVKNTLKTGEAVTMVSSEGGQKHLIVGRQRG